MTTTDDAPGADAPAPESESRRKVDYPVPKVLISIDKGARSESDRGPRVMSPEDVAEEKAKGLSSVKEAPVAKPLPAPSVPDAPESGAVLLAAAKDVHIARVELQRIDERLAEISVKAEDLGKLKAAAADAREQRTQLLSDALLAGKKANTVKLDELCVATLAALEKRRDEITAVERALAILQAQRTRGASALTEHERTYVIARYEHVKTTTWGRTTTMRFHEAIAKARANLGEMPAPFRERLLSAQIDLQADQLLSTGELLELVTAAADADLVSADELAAIPPPPEAKRLGYVWRDGLIREDPEPVAETACQSGAYVGLVAGA